MQQKYKILFLSDHPLSTSGVGIQARWLIDGLIATGKYSFRCFGGALQHPDMNTVTVNPDFIIKPTNGFGTPDLLRVTIAQEKPNAIVLFTDPRFFEYVFAMHDEIHQVCPIAYNHLWDNPPFPAFNQPMYELVDLFNCINWPTYEFCKERFPEKTNYIPHAVPKDLFFRLNDVDVKNVKQQILGKNRLDHFIVGYVGRNARRKMPSDIIQSFSMFLNDIEQKYGHRKATLLMHTDPYDREGPNLQSVIELFNVKDNVLFSNDRTGFHEMNSLYNISDVIVNRSCNEGFGVPLLEAKMAETPIIALKSGGMTRQVLDHETGFEYGVAIEPETKSLVGTQNIHYIYEDFCSHKTFANAITKMYEIGEVERRKIGKKAREHALKHYNMNSLISSWDESLEKLINNWKNNKPKQWEKFEL